MDQPYFKVLVIPLFSKTSVKQKTNKKVKTSKFKKWNGKRTNLANCKNRAVGENSTTEFGVHCMSVTN